ncbi:MAG: hypothetical protein AAF669_07955 [Pseudomonadota bacterium]
MPDEPDIHINSMSINADVANSQNASDTDIAKLKQEKLDRHQLTAYLAREALRKRY